jgi:hypothetical protein
MTSPATLQGFAGKSAGARWRTLAHVGAMRHVRQGEKKRTAEPATSAAKTAASRRSHGSPAPERTNNPQSGNPVPCQLISMFIIGKGVNPVSWTSKSIKP